jgi:ABC-type antimicrobial peptide transport system permease subunit
MTLQQEASNRKALRAGREAFAAFMVPLVALGSALWIGLLTLYNVWIRRPEIGLWRALGLPTLRIIMIFLGKAMLIGVVGAVAGYMGGWLAGALLPDSAAAPVKAASMFDARLLGLVLVGAPLLAVVAGWLPALVAARQDPALTLQEQ